MIARRIFLSAALAFALGRGTLPVELQAEEVAASKQQISAAVQRSVPYLQREGQAWIDERKCVSCHQVPFMLWGLNAAQAAGFEVDQADLKERSDWSLTWQSWQNPKNAKESDEATTAQGNVDTIYFLLLGREAYQKAESEPAAVENMRRLMLANQQADGSFKPGGQLPLQRRPIEETTQVSTMWALLALPADEGNEPQQAARTKALEFLTKERAVQSTEWHAARYLLDLQLGDDDAASETLKSLLEAQNDDGGWGWLTDEASDAFGTGVALYALGRAGDKRAELRPIIERAQTFLVTSQGADGGWLVPGTKTAAKGKPRPTSNYWGTAWAVIGLCETK